MGFALFATGFSLTEHISRRLSNKRGRSSHIVLSQKNIYIFPSGAGLIFLMLLATMLVTAINYQNSLIYLLTFLLGAIFFISIWLCFLNLQGLEIISGQDSDAFAGEALNFDLTLLQSGKAAPAIFYGSKPGQCAEAALEKGIKKHISIMQGAKNRGCYQLDRFYLATFYPFGLIRAWTWLKTESRVYIYPVPLEPVYVPSTSQAGTDSSSNQVTVENSGDLKAYSPGDSISRIAWKPFAARSELYIRAYDSSSGELDHWVDWSSYAATDTEQRLAMMCSDILRMRRDRKHFGLRLPGLEIAPGSGPAQETQCLRALAVFAL